jgi:hypothetical protein
MSSAFLTLTASSRVHAQRLAFTSLTARRALTQTSLRRDAPGGLKEDAIGICSPLSLFLNVSPKIPVKHHL